MMNSRWSFLAVPLLAVLGCSDPVPLPAQGAISLSIKNGSSGCPDSGSVYNVGAPTYPSQLTPGDSLVDGDKDARIRCSVKSSAGGFAFSGSLQASTTVPPYPITVNVSQGVLDASGKGTATIGVLTPKLGGFYNSMSSACTIQALGTPPQVKDGSIWASFSCPSLTQSDTLSGQCEIGPSVIVFENCDG